MPYSMLNNILFNPPCHDPMSDSIIMSATNKDTEAQWSEVTQTSEKHIQGPEPCALSPRLLILKRPFVNPRLRINRSTN